MSEEFEIEPSRAATIMARAHQMGKELPHEDRISLLTWMGCGATQLAANAPTISGEAAAEAMRRDPEGMRAILQKTARAGKTNLKPTNELFELCTTLATKELKIIEDGGKEFHPSEYLEQLKIAYLDKQMHAASSVPRN